MNLHSDTETETAPEEGEGEGEGEVDVEGVEQGATEEPEGGEQRGFLKKSRRR